MSSNVQRTSTAAQRPLEWMRFDPVKFIFLIDGLSLEEVGAVTKVMLNLWQFGPMREADVRRVCRTAFDVIRDRMIDMDGALSFDMVEDARERGKRSHSQRVEAGKASAAKRINRSANDERPFNDRSTDVLSLSVSSSAQEGKERGKPKKELDWPAFAGEKVKAKWSEFIAYRQREKQQRYKSVDTEQKALNLCAKYFPSGRMFVEALDHAMARTWTFPVDPSEHKYPFTTEAAEPKKSTLKSWVQ